MAVDRPTVVIVGGGFVGLSAARSLKDFSGRVMLIDRQNHHLFQPLLYQIATSVLSPEQIITPLRGVLGNWRNVTVIQGEVTGCDPVAKAVLVSNRDQVDVPVHYDFVIFATGVSLNYFGHTGFPQQAPGLKSLADALEGRNRALQAFELGEAEEDPARHRDLLTIALVGASPTGVEMAGALAIMVRDTLKKPFRRIDPAKTRIILVDAGARPVATLDPGLSEKVQKRLDALGVETMFGKPVDEITAEGFRVGDVWISCRTVIWTAGVTPSPVSRWLAAPMDKVGRVRVNPDLSLPGHPEIFVIGYTASLDQDGHPLPGVAQVALQGGEYAARVILAQVRGTEPPKRFRYFDKGNLAVVRRGFAILQTGSVKTSGLFTWLIWAFVYVRFLAQPGLRIRVFFQWIWTFLSGQRGARLIVGFNGKQ